MEEKEKVIKRLKVRRAKYKNRSWWLVYFLICQFLIWWIVNPDFIPSLNRFMSTIKEGLTNVLWPRSSQEFLTGSYRVYIYRMCQWIQQLPMYDLLAWAATRILPVWFLVNLVQIWVTTLRIKHVNKPPEAKKPKQKRKWKMPIIELLVGGKVCGLYTGVRETRKANLKKLQDSCTELQQEHVLWIGNIAKGNSGKAPQDKLYRLTPDKMIKIASGDGEYQIGLERTNSGRYHAVFRVSDQAPIPLTEGVPLVIAHKNEAGNEIREMTVTWIGGSV